MESALAPRPYIAHLDVPAFVGKVGASMRFTEQISRIASDVPLSLSRSMMSLSGPSLWRLRLEGCPSQISPWLTVRTTHRQIVLSLSLVGVNALKQRLFNVDVIFDMFKVYKKLDPTVPHQELFACSGA